MNATTGHSDFAHSNPQSGFAKRLRRDKSARQGGASRSPAIRNFASAFTLVELLVSISILTAIILVVSTLLTNAQRAVNLSQSTITADADARAVVERIRADLASLTTEGFLAIYTDIDGRPHLVFTAVGAYKSMIDSTIANTARIDYGRTGNSGKNVLWRRAMLLNAESAAVTANDHEKISLADYKVWGRSYFDYALYNEVVGPPRQYDWPVGGLVWFDCFTNTPSIPLPPNSLADLENLWPYLARPCRNLKIEWTDGECDATTKMLLWYNSDAPKKPDDWKNRNAAYQDTHLSEDAAEYDVEFDAGGERYCALWTCRKKDNWPLALRITFELGTGETAQTYEVIVDLPR